MKLFKKTEQEPATAMIPFFRRISVRMTLIILIILSLGIGSTIGYYVRSQNNTIRESRSAVIMEEANVIFVAIKNNMLSGEAPIAVSLFKDFSRIGSVGDIRLYRPDGVSAFSDNKTLREVNKNIGEDRFTPKTTFLKREVLEEKHFSAAVKGVDDISFSDDGPGGKSLVLYKPLLNQPKCSGCHGFNHLIRGVIRVSSPVTQVYEKTRMNMIISSGIYGLVVFLLLSTIVFFLRSFVISRIFRIGTVVEKVGAGDFKTKIAAPEEDEIGRLGQQINDMIDGLHERFKLSKFVSKATLEHVRDEDDITVGGEKRILTVPFSDIRGFTSFSEQHDPQEVMVMLNKVMNLQGDIIEAHGGDIDKFVGDEIMAIFEGEDMVERACKASLEIRDKMKKEFAKDDSPIQVGIGINTGEMISGNMGSGDRLDRTVIGDAVNLGARLCSIAGKNTIVISEFSYGDVKGVVEVAEHDPIKVKGKEEAVKIYTVRRLS